jgi:uncharacterized protein YkvS
MLLSLIETVLYFNPFVCYFKKMIAKERENTCDDEVLQQHYTPIQYAESLLKLAKFSLNKNEIAFAMSANNNHQQLLQRIQRITKTKIEQKNKSSFFISFALLIFLFTTLTLLYIPHHQTLKKKNSIANSVAITKAPLPVMQKNNSAKYNRLFFFVPKLNAVTTKASLPVTQKNNSVKYNISVSPKKNNQKINLRITVKTNIGKADESLNVALENLKQITIPELQNNIEEYRKNLSGEAAQQLVDDSLKQRIKNYVSAKNISITDFIKKVDSVKANQPNYLASVEKINNNSVIVPASYIEKDSLNQYVQQHQQIKHFIVIPNIDAAPFYLIIRTLNEDKEPLFIFIPYTPEQQHAD